MDHECSATLALRGSGSRQTSATPRIRNGVPRASPAKRTKLRSLRLDRTARFLNHPLSPPALSGQTKRLPPRSEPGELSNPSAPRVRSGVGRLAPGLTAFRPEV